MPFAPAQRLAIALASAGFAGLAVGATGPAFAQTGLSASATPAGPTYADLADLADGTPLVVRARIKQQAEVSAERAPGLRPGFARLYLEAETLVLIAGTVPLGESIRYLVDVPRDARGKVPKLKKREVVLFARPVAGRPSEVQLVRTDGQLAYSPQLEQRLRPVLAELAARDAPPQVTGISDALSVAGNLAGESETQLFLATRSGRPASIAVVRRPGMEPVWGVSWSEIIDRAASRPQPDTLAWYRLACSLPTSLPADANLAESPADRERAARDYRYVVEALGDCPRTL